MQAGSQQRSGLFVMKRSREIEPQSSAHGRDRRESHEEDEHGKSPGITQWIEIADAEEKPPQELRCCRGRATPGNGADRDGPAELLQDGCDHMEALRSEGETDGDLLCALRNRIRNQSDDADARHGNSDQTEQAHNHRDLLESFRIFTKTGLEQPDIWEQLWIQR